MTLKMRVGLGQFNELTDEKLLYIKQLGADDFLMNSLRVCSGSLRRLLLFFIARASFLKH